MMSERKYVYRVTYSQPDPRTGRNVFHIVLSEYPTISALGEALRSGPIVVEACVTTRTDDGVFRRFRIVRSWELVLSPVGFQTIEVPDAFEYVRE